MVDGNTSDVRPVGVGFQVGVWRNSGGLLGPGQRTFSNGLHTITLREREDGTILRSISITTGSAQCKLLPYRPPAEVAPSCFSVSSVGASVGCATFNGYDYVASEDYVVGPQIGFGGCSPSGVANSASADSVCGNITWTFQCSQVRC